MVQEETDILENEVEFVGDAVIVLVSVERFEEEYLGSSRGEEYYERVEFDGDVLEVECPLDFVYDDASPDVDYSGDEAVTFIQETEWDSAEIVDVETMEFRKDGDLWIASFDSSALDEFR